MSPTRGSPARHHARTSAAGLDSNVSTLGRGWTVIPWPRFIWLAALAPAPALAQDPPPPVPDSVTPLPEIVVTARNRGESVQDVPLAISAFSGQDLETRQIATTDQLGSVTPNLSFNSSGAFAGAKSAAQVFIRGVGQLDYLPVTDPGVAVYVDGIYMARSVGAAMDLLDVERVEVLRGPQGTLFGRNAVGGAVVLHSGRPDGEARRTVRAEFGSDRMRNATAVLSGRVADGLFAGLTLAYRKRDGYVTRVHDGLDMGDDDGRAARGTLVWRPSASLEVFALADYSRRRENGAPTVSGGVNDRMAFGAFGNALLPGCAAISINPAYPAEGPPSLPPPGTGAGGAPGCYGPDSFAGEYVAEGTSPAFADLDSWGGSIDVTWSRLGWARLRSLTGYRALKMETSRDADNTPANILSTQDRLDHAQISQEVQLSGLALGDRVHWQAGLYLFREEGYQRAAVIVPPGALHSGGDYENSSWAAFAQVTGEVTEALSLTVGGRYTRDRKGLTPDQYAIGDASQGSGSVFNPTWPAAAGVYLSPAGPMRFGDRMLPRRDFSLEFGAPTVAAMLSYRLTAGVTAYGGFSNGFKSGGFDTRYPAPPAGHQPNSPTAAPGTFEPETVSSYEVGLKSLWAGGRARVNVALFRADYDDIQVIIRESFNPITLNGGQAEHGGGGTGSGVVPGHRMGSPRQLGSHPRPLREPQLQRAQQRDPRPARLQAGQDAGLRTRPHHRQGHGPWRRLRPHAPRELDVHRRPVPRRDQHVAGSSRTGIISSTRRVSVQTGDGRWELLLAARNLTGARYLVTGTSAFDTSAAYVERVYSLPFGVVRVRGIPLVRRPSPQLQGSPRSIEFRPRALFLAGVDLGGIRARDLIRQNLLAGGVAGAFDLGRRIPQPRPNERLGTVEECFCDRHLEDRTRRFAP